MEALAILRDYLYEEREHPVPVFGEVAHLVYPPKEGSVGAVLTSCVDGTATLTVVAPAQDVAKIASEAKRVVLYPGAACGLGPEQIDGPRGLVGEMVRKCMLGAAIMRTGAFPFLSPGMLPSGPIVPGQDYSFQVLMMLRPRASLSGFGQVTIATPPRASREATARDKTDDEAWSDAVLEACADALAARLETVPPARHVELLRNEMANNFAQSVENGGTPWDEYTARADYDEAEFMDAMTQAALKALRRGMALDAMADHLKLMPTEDEVLAALGMVAPGRETEALDGVFKSGKLPQLCESTRRAKTCDHIARSAIGAEGYGEGEPR